MLHHIHGIVQIVGAPLAGARVPNAVSRSNYHYDGFRAIMDNDRVTADNDGRPQGSPLRLEISLGCINRYTFK